jgi:hypothetical protein
MGEEKGGRREEKGGRREEKGGRREEMKMSQIGQMHL